MAFNIEHLTPKINSLLKAFLDLCVIINPFTMISQGNIVECLVFFMFVKQEFLHTHITKYSVLQP